MSRARPSGRWGAAFVWTARASVAGSRGRRPLITHTFVAGDPDLDSDTVFGVKEALIVDFTRETTASGAGDWVARFDFILG